MTITATDGNANMATRDVKVTVTNAEEDGNCNPVSAPAAGRTGDNRGLQRSRRRVGQRRRGSGGGPNPATDPDRPWCTHKVLTVTTPGGGEWDNDCRCDFGQLHAGCDDVAD